MCVCVMSTVSVYFPSQNDANSRASARHRVEILCVLCVCVMSTVFVYFPTQDANTRASARQSVDLIYMYVCACVRVRVYNANGVRVFSVIE